MKLELTKNKTSYDAQLMLAGTGGVGTVPLNRDDGTQLELEIFYGDEVAGGSERFPTKSPTKNRGSLQSLGSD